MGVPKKKKPTSGLGKAIQSVQRFFGSDASDLKTFNPTSIMPTVGMVRSGVVKVGGEAAFEAAVKKAGGAGSKISKEVVSKVESSLPKINLTTPKKFISAAETMFDAEVSKVVSSSNRRLNGGGGKFTPKVDRWKPISDVSSVKPKSKFTPEVRASMKNQPDGFSVAANSMVGDITPSLPNSVKTGLKVGAAIATPSAIIAGVNTANKARIKTKLGNKSSSPTKKAKPAMRGRHKSSVKEEPKMTLQEKQETYSPNTSGESTPKATGSTMSKTQFSKMKNSVLEYKDENTGKMISTRLRGETNAQHKQRVLGAGIKSAGKLPAVGKLKKEKYKLSNKDAVDLVKGII